MKLIYFFELNKIVLLTHVGFTATLCVAVNPTCGDSGELWLYQ